MKNTVDYLIECMSGDDMFTTRETAEAYDNLIETLPKEAKDERGDLLECVQNAVLDLVGAHNKAAFTAGVKAGKDIVGIK